MAERPLLEGLYREHRALAMEAAGLQEAVRGLAASPDPGADGALGGRLRRQLAQFHEALRRHFYREQEGLYPEARQLISQGAGRGDIFGQFFAAEAEEDLGAHETLRVRVEEMTQAVAAAEQAGRLEAGALGRLRSTLGLVCDLLHRHTDKEDRFIYPMLQQSLDWEQRQRVRQRLTEMG